MKSNKQGAVSTVDWKRGEGACRVCDGRVPAETICSSPARSLYYLSVHELRVSLRSCDDHVHPDPHGLCRRGHHVVESIVGLHAEGQGGVRTLEDSNKENTAFMFDNCGVMLH